jgi:hypothetical protein
VADENHGRSQSGHSMSDQFIEALFLSHVPCFEKIKAGL